MTSIPRTQDEGNGLASLGIDTSPKATRAKTRAKARPAQDKPASNLEIKNAALEQSVSILREELGKANRQLESQKPTKLKQQLAAALEEIERMHANRIYADRPAQDSEIEALRLENQRQREELAKLDDDARFVIAQHKARIAELEAFNAQAVAIEEEEREHSRVVMAENCDLLAVNREQAEQLEDLQEAPCQECARKDQFISILVRDNAKLKEDLEFREGIDAVSKELLSPAQKASVITAIKALQKGTPDERGRVEIFTQDLADREGVSADTMGTHLRRINAVNILHYETEKVRDQETGKVTGMRCFIAPTPVSFQPWEYRLPTVELKRKHGGIPPECPYCHSVHLRKRVTISCIDCGKVLSDTGDGSGMSMDVPEDESHEWTPEPERQFARPVASVCQQARTVAASPVQIAQDCPSEAQETPAPVTGDGLTDQPEEAQETPTQHKARMDRLNADIWTEIEKKDPGCHVPAHIIEYWRIHDGRRYIVTQAHKEEARPIYQPEPARRTRKVANLATNRVEEVFA
jgi:hypothetical protein